MRSVFAIVMMGLLLCSCDESRLFEEYRDFDDRLWLVSDQPKFDFLIDDTVSAYSLYCNVRNVESYPYSDFRYTYYFTDSTGATTLGKKLMIQYLFDKKTGEPFGESGLGDIYEHQFVMMKDLKFKKRGMYSVRFEQFMRTDSLRGILAIGLRVERSEKD